MPRFLGVNYFKEASESYQKCVSEFTLTEPWHLERENDDYVHMRKSADKWFIRPWTKVVPDSTLLINEGEDIPEDFSEILHDFDPFEISTYHKLSGVIPCSLSDDETSHCIERCVTVVPESSNKKNDIETYDLHQLKSTLENGHKWYLEEPLIANYLCELYSVNHGMDNKFSMLDCNMDMLDETCTEYSDKILFDKYHACNDLISKTDANEPLYEEEIHKDIEPHKPLPDLMKNNEDYILQQLCNSASALIQKSDSEQQNIKQNEAVMNCLQNTKSSPSNEIYATTTNHNETDLCISTLSKAAGYNDLEIVKGITQIQFCATQGNGLLSENCTNGELIQESFRHHLNNSAEVGTSASVCTNYQRLTFISAVDKNLPAEITLSDSVHREDSNCNKDLAKYCRRNVTLFSLPNSPDHVDPQSTVAKDIRHSPHSVNSLYVTNHGGSSWHSNVSEASVDLKCGSRCVKQPVESCTDNEDTHNVNKKEIDLVNGCASFLCATQKNEGKDENLLKNLINYIENSVHSSSAHNMSFEQNECQLNTISCSSNLNTSQQKTNEMITTDCIMTLKPNVVYPEPRLYECSEPNNSVTFESDSNMKASLNNTLAERFDKKCDDKTLCVSETNGNQQTMVDGDTNHDADTKDCLITSSDSLLLELLKMEDLSNGSNLMSDLSVSKVDVNELSIKYFDRHVPVTSTPMGSPQGFPEAKTLNMKECTKKALTPNNCSQATHVKKAVGLVNPTLHTEVEVHVPREKQTSEKIDENNFQITNNYDDRNNSQTKKSIQLFGALQRFVTLRTGKNRKLNIKRKCSLFSNDEDRISEEKKLKLLNNTEAPPAALWSVGSITNSVRNEVMPHYERIKTICSSSLANNLELMSLLETRYNVEFVERDYETIFEHHRVKSTIVFADLIFDERTALISVKLTELHNRESFRDLRKRVRHLLLQFSVCWILVCHSTSSSLSLNSSFLKPLSKLSIWASQISSTEVEIQIKVAFCKKILQIAAIIRRVCDFTIDHHHELWSLKQSYDHVVLSPEISEREKFLLTFPCINSFSAQAILSLMTLQELFISSLECLQSKLKCLPSHSLQMLYEIVHWTSPVHNFCMQKVDNQTAWMSSVMSVTNYPKRDKLQDTEDALNVSHHSSLLTRESIKHMVLPESAHWNTSTQDAHQRFVDFRSCRKLPTTPMSDVIIKDNLQDSCPMTAECHYKSLSLNRTEDTVCQLGSSTLVPSPPMELPDHWSKIAYNWSSLSRPQHSPLGNTHVDISPSCTQGFIFAQSKDGNSGDRGPFRDLNTGADGACQTGVWDIERKSRPQIQVNLPAHRENSQYPSGSIRPCLRIPFLSNATFSNCHMAIYNQQPFHPNNYEQQLSNCASYDPYFTAGMQVQPHPVTSGPYPTVVSNTSVPQLYKGKSTSNVHTATQDHYLNQHIITKPAALDDIPGQFWGPCNDFQLNWWSQKRNVGLNDLELGTKDYGDGLKCQTHAKVKQQHQLCYEKVPGNHGQTRLKFI